VSSREVRNGEQSDTISVRMLWPFARFLGDYERELMLLRAAGFDDAVFADPDARIPRDLVRSMVATSLMKTGDLCLGLHAGEHVEFTDFSPVDQATRHCATLRESIVVGSRYVRLHDGGVRVHLVEGESTATLQIHGSHPSSSAVANEFQVVSVLKRMGLFLRQQLVPIEVWMRHEHATDAAEYARVFQAPVRLGTEYNAIVFRREVLDARAPNPNPSLLSSFHQKVDLMMSDLERGDTFVGQVRNLLVERLEDGVGIEEAARRLHVSEATLRRRLAEEGTTYKRIVDTVRKEHALAFMETRLQPAEVGYRVGFSNPGAFGRAFRRWTGSSPMEYKERRARQM
jgi:AraC-like DNA-binding protein